MIMIDVKKIILFGGWDFSVKEGIYRILCDVVKLVNCEVFCKNVVDFVNKYNLDGVDLDWEYFGVLDNMFIVGDLVEGFDYLIWFKSVCSIFLFSKIVFFVVLVLYWYFKVFFILIMVSYIDYVVYMIYDFYGMCFLFYFYFMLII